MLHTWFFLVFCLLRLFSDIKNADILAILSASMSAKRRFVVLIFISQMYARMQLFETEFSRNLLHHVPSSNKFECLRCRVACYFNDVYISLL